MRDQVTRLPAGLPGAMLQGSMTRQEVEQVRCSTTTSAAQKGGLVTAAGVSTEGDFVMPSWQRC